MRRFCVPPRSTTAAARSRSRSTAARISRRATSATWTAWCCASATRGTSAGVGPGIRPERSAGSRTSNTSAWNEAPERRRSALGERGVDLRRLGRTPEVVALREVAAETLESVGLLDGLDTFADHLQPERLAEVDDRLHQRGAFARSEVAAERAVDLEDVDRQLTQASERGVADAEVVERQAHAERLELVQAGRGGERVGCEQGLGDLEHQLLRRQAARAQRLAHVGDDCGVEQLAHREVDAQRERLARAP